MGFIYLCTGLIIFSLIGTIVLVRHIIKTSPRDKDGTILIGF